MANNRIKRQKYSEGSFVYDSYTDQGDKYKDMIMNPQGFIQQQDLQQQVANANAKNSWYQDGLSVVGQGLISAGVAQATGALGAKIAGSKTLSATAKKGLGLLNNVGGSAAGGFLHNLPNLFPNMFEQGGVAGEEHNIEHVPIEAEGGEMIAMPWDNEAMPIDGASHENGGVDMTVPVGSKIYSKRVKDAKGVSMAKRKQRRDRELKKWENIVKDDPNNKIAKDTLEKVRRNNEIEEANDMAYMQLHKAKKQFSDYIKSVTKDYGKGGGLNIAVARQASDDVHSMFGGEDVNEEGVPKYAEGDVVAPRSLSISQEKQALYNYLKNISDEFGHIYKNANTTKKDNRGDILFQSSKNANDLANLVLSALGEDAKTANWKKKNAIFKIVSELFGNVNKQGNFVYNVGGKRKSVVQFIKDKFEENGIFGEGTTEEQKEKAYSNFITSLNNIKGRTGVLGKISNKDGNNELNLYLPKDNNTTNTIFDNISGNTNTTINPSYTNTGNQFTIRTGNNSTGNTVTLNPQDKKILQALTTNSTGKDNTPKDQKLEELKKRILGAPLQEQQNNNNELFDPRLFSPTGLPLLNPEARDNTLLNADGTDPNAETTPTGLAKLIDLFGSTDNNNQTLNIRKSDLDAFMQMHQNNTNTDNTTKGKDNTKNKDSKLGKLFDALSDNLNSGNALQLAGIIHNMRKPMQAVLDNFRGKAQYRNFYRDYGKKSLLELDNMKDNIRQIRDENLRDLSDRQAAMMYSNNNSARDINVARAMNLATLAQITDAANKAYANYASMNNDVHKLRANALTDIDNKVMGEDKWADTMNREMRDSFFANKLEAQKAIGMGLQQMGKLFNRERYIKELKKHYEEMEKERRAATANNNFRPNRITIG